jgi:hypothetical protein
LLVNADSYKVDISFKRVKDKDIKEVVFAKFVPQIRRSK